MKIQKVIVEMSNEEYSQYAEYLKNIQKEKENQEKVKNLNTEVNEKEIQLLNCQVSAVLDNERIVLGVFNSYVDASEFIGLHRALNYNKRVPMLFVRYHTDNLNSSESGPVQVLTPTET